MLGKGDLTAEEVAAIKSGDTNNNVTLKDREGQKRAAESDASDNDDEGIPSSLDSVVIYILLVDVLVYNVCAGRCITSPWLFLF